MRLPADLSGKFTHVFVISPAVVLAIVVIIMIRLDGTNDVESEVELLVGLVDEIVMHRTLNAVFLIAHLIKLSVKLGGCVGALHLLFSEVHQNDDALFLTHIGRWVAKCPPHSVLLSALLSPQIEARTFLAPDLMDGVRQFGCQPPVAVVFLYHGNAVEGGIEVATLITAQRDGQLGAIAVRHGEGLLLGWSAPCRHSHQQP